MNEFYHKTNIEGENMARPMTMAEKILAAHAGLEEVVPGQLIECDLDLVLSNDVTAPIAIKEFKKVGVDKVFDPTKIALVPDHYVPNKDIQSAEQAKMTREFAREQGITHFYEVGCMGVEHALLPEQGVVGAGDLIIGADSHTCTHWELLLPVLVLPMLLLVMQLVKLGLRFLSQSCLMLKDSFSLALPAKTLFCISLV